MINRLIAVLLGGVDARVRLYIRVIIFLRERQKTCLSRLVSNRLQKAHGVFLSSDAEFDRSLTLKHPVGVVVGNGVKLGSNVTIFQNVTIGGGKLGDGSLNKYPAIGDGTVVYAGAVVIGGVKVGKNCVVGANSVVNRDVPDYTTVAGVPARIIASRSTIRL